MLTPILSCTRIILLRPWVDSLVTVDALKDTFIFETGWYPLHALMLPLPPTNKTAVIVHGYTDNAIRMFMIGYLYNHDLQYNVLLPDLQHQGESGGPAIQMGWKDRLDVMQWMHISNATIRGQYPTRKRW